MNLLMLTVPSPKEANANSQTSRLSISDGKREVLGGSGVSGDSKPHRKHAHTLRTPSRTHRVCVGLGGAAAPCAITGLDSSHTPRCSVHGRACSE